MTDIHIEVAFAAVLGASPVVGQPPANFSYIDAGVHLKEAVTVALIAAEGDVNAFQFSAETWLQQNYPHLGVSQNVNLSLIIETLVKEAVENGQMSVTAGD